MPGLTPPTAKKQAKYDTAGLYCAMRIMYPIIQTDIVPMRKYARFW